MCNLHSIKSQETRVCKNVSSKNKGRCRDGAVCLKGIAPGAKTVGTRRRAGPCKEGGQPVHAKPRSLTFANFEYICTIPTSGNILLHHLLLHIHSSYSASSLHLQVQLYNLPISLLCCAPSSLKISTRFSAANCLLLNHLCCMCSRI